MHAPRHDRSQTSHSEDMDYGLRPLKVTILWTIPLLRHHDCCVGSDHSTGSKGKLLFSLGMQLLHGQLASSIHPAFRADLLSVLLEYLTLCS